MKPTLTHIALHVRDIEACIDFYQRYCSMQVVHRRASEEQTIVWLAEAGREEEFIIVMMSGGYEVEQANNDYSHLGFAMASREAVDEIAKKAKVSNELVWPPKDEPYPVGYYCGLKDPNGTLVEFSFGQPLGPNSA